jgi:hypothetical protein
LPCVASSPTMILRGSAVLDDGVPPPSASMDEYRTLVGQRAARLDGRHRRRLGVTGGVGLLVVLVATLLVARPGSTPQQSASSTGGLGGSPSRSSGSGQLGQSEAKAGSTKGGPGNMPSIGADAPGLTGSSGSPDAVSTPPCPSNAICIDTAALETSTDGGTKAAPISLGTNQELVVTLISSTTRGWSLPHVTSGSSLVARGKSVSSHGTTTTELVATGRSGTADVAVHCAGSGCVGSTFHVHVTVRSGPLRPINPSSTGAPTSQ